MSLLSPHKVWCTHDANMVQIRPHPPSFGATFVKICHPPPPLALIEHFGSPERVMNNLPNKAKWGGGGAKPLLQT